MSTEEEYENNPLAVAALPAGLRDMLTYAQLHPPTSGWSAKHDAIVHLHPHVRFRIKLQTAEFNSMTYGLYREDLLEELGVFGAELDSKAFANNLMSVLGDHLSIRNLEHLRAAVDQQLQEQLDMRTRCESKLEIETVKDQ